MVAIFECCSLPLVSPSAAAIHKSQFKRSPGFVGRSFLGTYCTVYAMIVIVLLILFVDRMDHKNLIEMFARGVFVILVQVVRVCLGLPPLVLSRRQA